MVGKPDYDRALDAIDLRLKSASDDDGVSISDIMARTGRGSTFTREWMRGEIANGRWERAGRRRSESLDGKTCWTPLYRPTRKTTKSKSRN